MWRLAPGVGIMARRRGWMSACNPIFRWRWMGYGGAALTLVAATLSWLTRALAPGEAADGRGPEGDSQCTGWLDAGDGALPMEQVFTRAFIPEIDRRFRTVAARWGRALLGVSAGGYAAFNLGTRHPGAFGAIAAHSGYFVAEDDDEVVQPMLGADSPLVQIGRASCRERG